MASIDLTALRRFVKENGAVLLVLILGAALMLLPGGSSDAGEGEFNDEEEKLSLVLSQIEGAGYCRVLFRAESAEQRGGAVIVCEGADSAAVQLRITQAVGTYTGLGSDRITILKSG